MRKITEVTIEPEKHPLAFASREIFSCYSAVPNANKQNLMYKSALIAEKSTNAEHLGGV